ncbi:Nif3-like dinuclear metal center hexameric protein, partial [bacterium]
MKLADLARAMEDIAPLAHAESWDNVGLLAGDLEQPVARVQLTIDFTRAVAEECVRERCDAVVAYHPPIFAGLKRIDPASSVALALRHGVAIYSPHTALDAAHGGTNDVLADVVEMTTRAPLRAKKALTPGAQGGACKLVTFVPEHACEALSRALFDAGAGAIGEYAACSFRTQGTGTFFGSDAASPVVGERGRLETVDEIRLETIVPAGKVDAVVAALRAAHPYEEPAFDLLVLRAPPPTRTSVRDALAAPS